jgi:hypothetical protein
MTNDSNSAHARVSNWTLATGTKPGAREVYPPGGQKRGQDLGANEPACDSPAGNLESVVANR